MGLLMMNQSRSAMTSLIHDRMLDIANTAAAMLDGDVMKGLNAEDFDSEAYQAGLQILSIYLENIDLQYIYCVLDRGNGNFVFGIDPAPDAGEFGSPVITTDALISASKGRAAVDKEPYEDEWGKFYSAYSPVFDSEGNVACIVAVDFSATWFEAQIRAQTRTVLAASIISLCMGALIILVITSQLRKRLRTVYEQVNGLTDDVEILADQIHIPAEHSQTQKIISTDPGNQIDDIRRELHTTQEKLKDYISYINSLAYMDALTGLGNRTAYLEKTLELDRQIAEKEADFAVAVLDINGLKQVNDQFGHDNGDLLITRTGDLLKTIFGAENAYRIGGDEFLAVMEGMDRPGMEALFARLDESLPASNEGFEIQLNLSKGLAVFDSESDAEYRQVFKRADQAMYADKAAFYRAHGDRRRV